MRVKKFPHRKRTRSILTGSLAVAVTVVAAACSSGGSSGGSGGGTTTLKIITWVNPPAVQAINKIDAEFEKANPDIKVKLQTAANVNGPYETLLQQIGQLRHRRHRHVQFPAPAAAVAADDLEHHPDPALV